MFPRSPLSSSNRVSLLPDGSRLTGRTRQDRKGRPSSLRSSGRKRKTDRRAALWRLVTVGKTSGKKCRHWLRQDAVDVICKAAHRGPYPTCGRSSPGSKEDDAYFQIMIFPQPRHDLHHVRYDGLQFVQGKRLGELDELRPGRDEGRATKATTQPTALLSGWGFPSRHWSLARTTDERRKPSYPLPSYQLPIKTGT